MSIQQVQQHQQPDSLGQDGREEAFNIMQLDSEDVCFGHPSIHAAMAAIRDVNGLQWPAAAVRVENSDVLNFLGSYFGFQRDNIRNQREQLALLLANAHIRHACYILVVAKSIRGKLLENYEDYFDVRQSVHRDAVRTSAEFGQPYRDGTNATTPKPPLMGLPSLPH